MDSSFPRSPYKPRNNLKSSKPPRFNQSQQLEFYRISFHEIDPDHRIPLHSISQDPLAFQVNRPPDHRQFHLSSHLTMVNEREPSRAPLSPQKNNIGAQIPAPEFGKPSPLRPSSARPNIFNYPSSNKPRPEHHRQISTGGSRTGNYAPISELKTRPIDTNPPFRPHPVQASQDLTKGSSLSSGETLIARPIAPKVADTVASGPKYYSSVPNRATYSGGFTAVNPDGQPANFIDLTKKDDRFDPDAALYDGKFGSVDPYAYIDIGRANENIKALLEGAFDDEDDKPRTRSRKKKTAAAADELADQLKDLTVKTEGNATKEEEQQEEEEFDDGSIEGLVIKLLPHQIDGVSWMREKESGVKKKNGLLPKGGILADDMGLGKTIQSIALILTNPRPPISQDTETSKKPGISSKIGKGTLVVAPLALIKQWESEIKTHVLEDRKLKVYLHHGPQRTKRFDDLKKYDVVITTYQILVSEFSNSSENIDGLQTGCFGIHWYRVILDEAHTIKNRNAKATQACYALRSEYRWCLSGTPMQNNLDELQSLIKFLRIKPYDELSVWREQITKPMNNGRGGVAIKRLQYYLRAFMKRRTKDILKQEGALTSGMKPNKDGSAKPTFKVTARRVEKVIAHFNDKERQCYQRLEKRTDMSLEQMMSGSKLNYASALVLLLRLRQACNHPKLVNSDLSKDKDALSTGGNAAAKSKGVESDLDDMARLMSGLTVETKYCDICRLEIGKDEAKDGSKLCKECVDDFEDDKNGRSPSPSQEVEESKLRSGEQRPIVIDSEDEEEHSEFLISPGDLFKRSKTIPADENTSTLISKVENNGLSLVTKQDISEEMKPEEATSLVASTKIAHLLEILGTEIKEHKFIVFSQFTSMLDLVEPFLKQKGYNFTRYDGSMRNDAREASLDSLRNDHKTRVLLCSLKCGSLGLNLTAASRVVILEPFWNPFVEEQAIDRVHRLTQKVDVTVYKITIKDTVEERILDLQEKKRELANAAIEGKSVAKLSMKDIMQLFRHDAGHVDVSNGPHSALTEKVGLVSSPSKPNNQYVSSSSQSTGSGRPRIAESSRQFSGWREDSVYSRRW